jgi:hypothetical protein
VAKFLLLPIYVIALAVPFFNRDQPELFGFPFFYWYQLLTVPAGALLIFIVFKLEDKGQGE